MSCTLKSVGEVRPRRPSANHDPGPTPSAGVVLIPEPCPTAAPWQLRATRFDRVGALGHVLPPVLDRGLVQLLMLGRVPAGQFHRSGEDFTARASAFVGHHTAAGAIETVFPCRSSRAAAACRAWCGTKSQGGPAECWVTRQGLGSNPHS